MKVNFSSLSLRDKILIPTVVLVTLGMALSATFSHFRSKQMLQVGDSDPTEAFDMIRTKPSRGGGGGPLLMCTEGEEQDKGEVGG